jgi:hypothetical protein
LSLIGERHTDEVAIAPDQPTLSDGMKIVERQFKLQWYGRQIVDTNAGINLCHISDGTRSLASLAATNIRAPLTNLVLPIDRRSNALSH